MRNAFIASLFLLFSTGAVCQYQDFLKTPDDWSGIEVPVVQDELSPGHFLYDSLSYDFKWKKERFVRLFVERKMCFRVSKELLDEGELSLPLPVSTDPFSDARSLRELDSPIPAQLFNVRIIHFQARKLTGYGNTERVLKTTTFDDDSLRLFNRDEPNFTYDFKLLELTSGDILQVHYKYEVPYEENWIAFSSFRVFLGDLNPKKSFHFELSHEDIRRLELSGVEPDTTLKVGSKKVYRWTRRDLTENLYAFNGRPFKDIGWIGIRFNTNGEIFKDFYRGGGYRYLPYWREVLQRRFYKLPMFYRISKKRILLDRQNQMIDDFIEEVSSRDRKSDPAVRAMLIHQEINDSFEYLADEEYYDLEDMSLENIGLHVAEDELRDISRFHLYAKILMRMEVPFRVVLMEDSRYFNFSENHLPRAMNNDIMFEIYGKKGGTFLLWPKGNRGGLEVSEYPFYWEGSTAMNVNPFDLWSRYDCDYLIDTLFYYNKHENMRMTNMKVSFDSSFTTAEFNTDIRLSGQMSTVLRNYLRYGDKDKWIHQNYYKELFSDVEGRNEITPELTNFQRVYPYKSSFELNYKTVLSDAASPILGNNGIVEIPFTGWTNLIVFPEVFEIENRIEPYYPDFLYDDIYNILVELPKGFEWNNISEFEDAFENSFGSISTEVSEMDTGKFLISIHFSIDQTRVDPKDFAQVKSFYREVEKISDLSFLFQKRPVPLD